MCGIAGIIRFDEAPVPEQQIRRAVDRLVHRGPDDGGWIVRSNVALGNRRLSILDPSAAGHQPMSNEDGRSWIVYNGEVFNCRELRADLERLGHRFRSHTDTEVILHLYETHGPRAVEYLNGMFAFAIYHQRTEKVLIARDRYGIKPLYFSQSGKRLIFASEIKALLTNPELAVDLCPEALSEYLAFQNQLSDRTLFKGVRMFPQGSWMEISRVHSSSPETRLHRYWEPRFRSDPALGSEDEVAEELRSRFQVAVRRQLLSDVPVGSFLSGGMDSGSITAVAAREIPHLDTFTCGFEMDGVTTGERHFDERRPAALIADALQTTHHESVLGGHSLSQAMAGLTWHLEDPRVGMSYPNYYAAQLASEFVPVVLSGTGGDELFGGYPWRYHHALSAGRERFMESYFGYWQRLVPESRQGELFQPGVWAQVRGRSLENLFRSMVGEHLRDATDLNAYVDAALGFELQTFLHGLFVVEDKLSMAHSLEARVPFLDNDLVDFALQIPANYKVSGLEQFVGTETSRGQYGFRASGGKMILRKAMSTLLPSGLAERQKQGFSAPDESWFRSSNADYVRSMLLHPRTHLYQYIQPKYVERVIAEHLAGKANHRLLIWSLLSVEWWLKVFAAGDVDGIAAASAQTREAVR